MTLTTFDDGVKNVTRIVDESESSLIRVSVAQTSSDKIKVKIFLLFVLVFVSNYLSTYPQVGERTASRNFSFTADRSQITLGEGSLYSLSPV